ncbi:hypothetical protein ABIE67_000410 [Streptomyces sp. V4I8]|uniref:hypothetical protein n=1 Tax=Streptomyces sp. V4I8 TaxID=3156469 RepID=UPI003519B44D
MIDPADTGPVYVGWLKSLRTLTQEEVDARARAHHRYSAQPHEVFEARQAHAQAPSAH